ncbi:MAG: hypothetical protein U1D99_04160, partial [Candidatus Omnitrophota bacterium]|nr:hypothetical protein [Candidatus Omnitrophota bacterium]
QRALLDYASSLEVNADDAVRRDGGWDEDTLVVLIYAAEGVRRKRRLAATGLLVGGVIVAALVLSVIFILDHFLL